MLWVRNLRRYIGSGAGLGSEALMELETKRILLEIFKEKQQKSQEAGTIPSFYKKKPEEGSISQRVQRLAKYSPYPMASTFVTSPKPFLALPIKTNSPSLPNHRLLGFRRNSLKVSAISTKWEPTKVVPQADRVLVRLEVLPEKSR